MSDAVAVEAVDAVVALTARELLILQLLARGYTDVQIARLIEADSAEVERCLRGVQQRLYMHSTSCIVAFAILHGLIV